MASYTIYTTYILEPITGATQGYGKAIHCNYIKSMPLDSDNISGEEIRMNLKISGETNFKFLSNNVANGTGFTAHKIYALVQIINHINYTNIEDIKPISYNWKKFDVTSQVIGYTSGSTFMLTPANLILQVFTIPLLQYYNTGSTLFTPYNISYLNYPSNLPIADKKLCFGDETYFFGNVATDIHADVFTTNLSINLPLGEFNSSGNLTWNGETIAITEIGIYDLNKNLVAIGKLNDPVEKNETIARTIQFAIDF